MTTPPPREAPTIDGLTVIGWREWVRLDGLGIDAIKAKVDTGARTSSLHAWDITEVDSATLRFGIHPLQMDDDVTVTVEAPLLEYREVRSSNGEAEERPVIVTPLVVAGIRFEAEITLTRRDEMGFRMLLGREAMKGRFLVDPGTSYRGGRRRRPRTARK